MIPNWIPSNFLEVVSLHEKDKVMTIPCTICVYWKENWSLDECFILQAIKHVNHGKQVTGGACEATTQAINRWS